MQVQLIDPAGRQFNIESRNPEIILLWVGEYIPQINDKGWRIRIWLATETEARIFGQPYMTDTEWTVEGLRSVQNYFRRAAENLQKKERGDDKKESKSQPEKAAKRSNSKQEN